MYHIGTAVGGAVTNMTVASDGTVYFMRDDYTVCKLPKEGVSGLTFLENRCGHVRHMTTDSEDNLVILTTEGCIEVMDTNSTDPPETYFDDEDYDIKYINTDVHGKFYMIADMGDGDEAFEFRGCLFRQLPNNEPVRTPFAVDSRRRIYYDTFCVADHKYPITRLKQEKVNCVCVDQNDNAYFGCDSGLFFLAAGTRNAVQMMDVIMKGIFKIEVAADGTVYYASSAKHGGGIRKIVFV